MLQVASVRLGTTAAWVRINLFFHLVIHTRLARQHLLNNINTMPRTLNTLRINNIPPCYTTRMPIVSTQPTCRTVSSVTIEHQSRSIRLGRLRIPGHCLPVIPSITKWVVSHMTSSCHVTIKTIHYSKYHSMYRQRHVQQYGTVSMRDQLSKAMLVCCKRSNIIGTMFPLGVGTQQKDTKTHVNMWNRLLMPLIVYMFLTIHLALKSIPIITTTSTTTITIITRNQVQGMILYRSTSSSFSLCLCLPSRCKYTADVVVSIIYIMRLPRYRQGISWHWTLYSVTTHFDQTHKHFGSI